MTLQILSTPSDQAAELLREAIEQAIPGAEVKSTAGRFRLRGKYQCNSGHCQSMCAETLRAHTSRMVDFGISDSLCNDSGHALSNPVLTLYRLLAAAVDAVPPNMNASCRINNAKDGPQPRAHMHHLSCQEVTGVELSCQALRIALCGAQ